MKKTYRNGKPSKEFDAIYGTKLAQDYEFPFQLSADDVWKVIKESNYGDLDSEKYNIIMDNIVFPYVDMKTLTVQRKRDVLMGMASCINSDDILWYIEGNYACAPASLEVDLEMRIVLGNFIVQNHVGWVISRKTWERLKAELSVLAD